MALAGIFLVAATTKLLDMRGFRVALEGFGVKGAWVTVGAVVIPVAELVAAGLAIPAATARAGAALAIVLLVSFGVAIVLALRRGAAPECHCFGQLHSRPAGGETLARNALFAALAVIVVAAGPGPELGSWLAVEQRRGDRPDRGEPGCRRRGLRLRLDVAGEPPAGGPRRRPAAWAAADGWPRSSAVRDCGPSGAPVSSRELLAERGHAVLVFTSAGCEPCLELMPELARWRQMLEGRLSIQVIAAGDEAENRRHAAEHRTPILLDPDGAVRRRSRSARRRPPSKSTLTGESAARRPWERRRSSG